MFTKTRHFFTPLLLGSMIVSPAFGMNNRRPNPCRRAANCLRRLNPRPLLRYLNPGYWLTNGMAQGLGEGVADGFNNGFQAFNEDNIQNTVNRIAHAIIDSINDQQNTQALVHAIGTLFNSSAQVLQQQFAQGGNSSAAINEFLNAVTNSLGNLFQRGEGNNQGAGRQALTQFSNMIQDALRENGEFTNIIREFFNRNDVVSQGIGRSLRSMFQEVNRELGDGLRQFNQEIGTGLRDAGNHFAEGGNGRRAMGNIRESIREEFTGRNGLLGEIEELAIEHAWKIGGITITTTLGVATAYFGTQWFWNTYMKWWFKKPHVIIDSSKKRSLWSRLTGSKPDLPEMVFAPHLKQRLESLVHTTKSITKKIKHGKKNIKYRNLLLWGPPGTGKTMFAKQLAEKSGMEWVMVTGSSFFQKNAGIKAIDELFRWAEKSSKGLLIFIDEADSLLPDRNKLQAGTQNYQIVNHILNYLGERSQKYMVVMSTNHKTAFDSAMQRRIDDLINMPLPGLNERAGVLKLYRNRVLLDAKENSTEFINSIRQYLDDNKINDIAKRTNGLSNGDLSGIINTIITEADEIVTPTVIKIAVQRALKKHQDFNHGTARRRRRARVA